MARAQNIYDGERFGRTRCDTGTYPRHRHPFEYICVVINGGFTEAGDAGRFRLRPGDVLVHRSFEAHMDVFGASAADVLNLPLVHGLPEQGLVRCNDLDAVVLEAERDPWSAAMLVAAAFVAAAGEQDWPDLLAQDLSRNHALEIAAWSSVHALAPATVSRGFRLAYGTSPARFRAEARARQACRLIATSMEPLSAVAAELGFSDQAHMTRAVKEISGVPPARLRALRSN
jgi:AraC-like DNA-binding protein